MSDKNSQIATANMALNPTRAIYSILGNICKNPDFLKNPEIVISGRDFVQDFHKIVFTAINNIAYSKGDVSHITPVDIDNYLSQYPIYYKTWDKNEGLQYMQDSIDHSNGETFMSDYDRLKKFSLLRNFESEGIDVSNIYDYKTQSLKDMNENSGRLDEMSIGDIVEHFTQKIIGIRDDWNVEKGIVKDFIAGDDLDTLLDRIQNEPDMGFPFMNLFYNSLFRGMRKGKFLLRSGATGTGKAIVHGTKIPTPDGWKVVEDIKIGDSLFDKNGKPTKVLGVYPQGKQQVYRVTLKDGRYIDCNAEHLWQVKQMRVKNRPEKTMTTLEIIEKMESDKKKGIRGYTLALPVNKAVDYKNINNELPVDPYVLGAILGDGCITQHDAQFNISSGNDDIPNEIARILNTKAIKSKYNYTYRFLCPENFDKSSYKHNKKYLSVPDVFEKLDELIGCNSRTKYIPDIYMTSSYQERLSLLQGLIDTDGSTKGGNGKKAPSVSFGTTSDKLLEQVSELAFSLGIQNHLIRDKCGYGGEVSFKMPSKDLKILLRAEKEKINKVIDNENYNDVKIFDCVKITKVEKLDEIKEQVCFTVDNEEHLFLVGNFVVTHNTRQAIMDMCKVTCSEIYITGRGWQSLGPSYPGLFISTELDKEEVQLIMLAFLTGIPDTEIKNGNYDAGTYERLRKGIEVLKKAPFFVSYIEDFSISDIEMKIEQYIIKEGVQYASFDYIQMVPKLAKSMQQNFGTSLREDQILVHFSAALKGIAARYEIFLESSTQLNRGSKEVENRDASSLRGGLATADKVDHGVLTFKVTKQDRENVKHILQNGFENKEPNFAHWVYKNRAGIDHVIIWTNMNLGNMREEVLFVTDYDYNIIDDLNPLEIVTVDENVNNERANDTIEEANIVPDF